MAGSRLNFIENRVAPLCTPSKPKKKPPPSEPSTPRPPAGFDVDSLPIMQQSRRERLAAAKTGFDMGIPLNELTKVLDLGFRPLPWGNTGYLPTKHQPLTKS